MGMTDAQIKALQPRAARYLVSDGRGLSLDILPSGVKSWMYRYRHDGKHRRRSHSAGSRSHVEGRARRARRSGSPGSGRSLPC
jgi:hypothetical protein